MTDSILLTTGELPGCMVHHKVCIAGEPGVGKTSLFLRMKTGEFHNETVLTSRIDTHKFVHTVNDIQVPLTLHDTAGYERLGTLTPNFFRGAVAVLMMFSIEEVVTLQLLDIYITEAKRYAHENCYFILVANKIDLFMDIDEETLKHAKKHLGCDKICYISAKTGRNISGLFNEVALQVHSRSGGRDAITLDENNVDNVTTTNDKCWKKICE